MNIRRIVVAAGLVLAVGVSSAPLMAIGSADAAIAAPAPDPEDPRFHPEPPDGGSSARDRDADRADCESRGVTACEMVKEAVGAAAPGLGPLAERGCRAGFHAACEADHPREHHGGSFNK